MLKTAKSKTLAGLISLISLIVLGTGVHPQAVFAANSAQNPYEMGHAYYKKGEYAKARHYYEHVANLKPQYWPVHYALGNTYMKLGELQLAKQSYMSCLIARPDVPTCKNCSKAMEYLNIALAKKEKADLDNEIATADKTKQPANAPKDTAVVPHENSVFEAKVKELTAKRDAILEEGKRQAAAIHAKYEAQFEWIDQNTNQWVRNIETGERRTGLDIHTHANLCAERDHEIKRVTDIAEARARGIQIPTINTLGTSISSSNLHPHSNHYVRHYKHKPSHQQYITQGQNRKVAAGNSTTTSK